MTKTMESLITEAESLLPRLDEVLELSNSLMELSLNALSTPSWGHKVHQANRKAIATESRRQHKIKTVVVPVINAWLERARAEAPTADRGTVRRAAGRLKRLSRAVDSWTSTVDYYRGMVVLGERQHAEHAELIAENIRMTRMVGSLDDVEPPVRWH